MAIQSRRPGTWLLPRPEAKRTCDSGHGRAPNPDEHEPHAPTREWSEENKSEWITPPGGVGWGAQSCCFIASNDRSPRPRALHVSVRRMYSS